jgi:hypothetical protein
MKAISPFIVILALGIASCGNGTPAPSELGRYAYTAFDSLGVEVARGWLTISSKDSTTISGNWDIGAVGTPDNIGPQVGSGELTGLWHDGQLLIELNPQYADNNVSLIGSYDGERYGGTWMYTGFPGILNHGSFSALRLRDWQ